MNKTKNRKNATVLIEWNNEGKKVKTWIYAVKPDVNYLLKNKSGKILVTL